MSSSPLARLPKISILQISFTHYVLDILGIFCREHRGPQLKGYGEEYSRALSKVSHDVGLDCY